MVLKELYAQKKHRSKGAKISWKIAMYLLIVLGILVLLIPALIIATQLTQYLPDKSIRIPVEDQRTAAGKSGYDALTSNKKYSALTYNVGYNAYNQNMHFFMDGDGQWICGQGKSESKESTVNSLLGVDRVLSANHDFSIHKDSWDNVPTNQLRGCDAYKTIYNSDGTFSDSQYTDIDTLNTELGEDGLFDFVSIEEQDRDSTRSQYYDEYEALKDMGITTDSSVTDPNDNPTTKIKDLYNSVFAYNFVVPFLPVPLDDMHGQVLSGVTTLSRFTIQNNDEDYPTRESLPNITTFPLNMFELKRCATISRYKTDIINPLTGYTRQLVYITAHFSAYDKSGEIRRKQLGEINDIFEKELAEGNYVIVGADWNQTLPGCYGYEGSDIYGEDGPQVDPDDPAIMAWDYEDFVYDNKDAKNPDVYKNFAQSISNPNDWYSATNDYKKGDCVFYQSDAAPDQTPLSSLTYYMHDPTVHLYESLVDHPTEAPIVQTGGTYVKSDQWRYHLSKDYTNVSLTKKVRTEILPVSMPTKNPDTGAEEPAKANIYTIHAMPTLRNAGFQYRNESTEAHNNGVNYTGGHIYKSNIDGFLVSSNITVNFTFGFDNNYKYADHNPVGISFTLNA